MKDIGTNTLIAVAIVALIAMMTFCACTSIYQMQLTNRAAIAAGLVQENDSVQSTHWAKP